MANSVVLRDKSDEFAWRSRPSLLDEARYANVDGRSEFWSQRVLSNAFVARPVHLSWIGSDGSTELIRPNCKLDARKFDSMTWLLRRIHKGEQASEFF